MLAGGGGRNRRLVSRAKRFTKALEPTSGLSTGIKVVVDSTAFNAAGCRPHDRVSGTEVTLAQIKLNELLTAVVQLNRSLGTVAGNT
jgi:hypothetical protein